MSNVGWSPSGPTPQPGAVIVDNGDGSGTITNPDGTVISFCTECLNDTDTFSTYDKSTNTLTTAAGDVVPLGEANTVWKSNPPVVNADGSETTTFDVVDSAGNVVTAGVWSHISSPSDPVLTDAAHECGDKFLALKSDGSEYWVNINPPQEEILASTTLNATRLSTDIRDSSDATVPGVFEIGPTACVTVTNPSECETMRVDVLLELRMFQASTYTGTSTGTLHEMDVSADGGVTWLTAIQNGRLLHTHINTQAAGIQLTSENSATLQRNVGVLLPGASMDVCVRVRHYVSVARSPTTVLHQATTLGSAVITLRDM